MKSISAENNELSDQTDVQSHATSGSHSWVQRPMFWRPSYLATSAWQEHIPFAFWVMQAHRPQVFVELGVHYGVSYFAFCQAVSRLGLDTSCYGIDTFKGDMHSGEYDESVYEQVKKQNESQYSGFSSIVRSTFDDALSHFQDESIDLLHIDGMHTFASVRSDFESWLPKLSPRAVVLMHDTNVRERGFGVAKLFRELCERYPYFEFIHGHGLGILGVGKEQSKPMRQLFALSRNELERQMIREAFASLGQGCASIFHAKENERKAATWMEQAELRDKQLKYVQQSLEKTKAEVDELNAKLSEQSSEVHADREKLAHEKGNLEGKLELLGAMHAQFMSELVPRKAETTREINSDEMEALKKGYADYELRNQELETRLLENAEQVSASKRLAEEAEIRLQSIMEELSSSHIRLAQLEQELDQEKTLSEQMQAELSASNKKNLELEEENTAQLNQLSMEMRTQIQNLASENSRLKEELRVERVQMTELRRDLENRSKQADASKEIEELRRRHAEQMQKIASELASHKAQLAERFDELAELTKMLEEQNAALRDKDEQTSIMASGMDELKKMYEQAQEEIAGLKNETAAKTSSLEERFREIAMLTQVVQQRETELNSKNEELHFEKERADHFRDLLETQTTSAETRAEMPVEKAEESSGEKAVKRRKRASRLSIDTQISLLDKSEILDKDWYLQEYEDVARSGMTPAEHYVLYGAAEGRQPGPDFDTSWYVTNYPDVAEMGVNPAVHYLKYGKKEGRATYSIKRS